jgi:hypothetical protein
MWIDLDEAIRIYAKMLRVRHGPAGAAKAAHESAEGMRARADWPAAKVWQAVAAASAATQNENRK